MKRILIDTDVILDLFFDREPFSENAAKVLSLCEKKDIIGFVTPVIISNVYYLLSQKAKQEKTPSGNNKKPIKNTLIVFVFSVF